MVVERKYSHTLTFATHKPTLGGITNERVSVNSDYGTAYPVHDARKMPLDITRK
jgi:hypothetical protein